MASMALSSKLPSSTFKSKNGICQLIRQLYVYFQCNAVCPQRQKLVVQDTVDGFMLGVGDALSQIQIISRSLIYVYIPLHVVGFQEKCLIWNKWIFHVMP